MDNYAHKAKGLTRWTPPREEKSPRAKKPAPAPPANDDALQRARATLAALEGSLPDSAPPVPPDALAAAAKAQQRLVDTESRLFGGGVGATHPFVLTLLAACVGLHFYNADLQTKREEEEELLERLRARRRARPLSADELDHALARKRRLLEVGDGDAADAARLSEEIARLEAERRNV